MIRYLIVGDIHGCYDEFSELLDRAGLTDDDQLIAIGDLINKGPYSLETFEFFRHARTPNIRSLMGNHEYKHLRAYRGEIDPPFSVMVTRWQFGRAYDDAIDFITHLPFSLELPDALLVHAYFEPGIALEDQAPHILVGTMGAEKYLKKKYRRPWYTFYEGSKPIIVGHRDISDSGKPFIYDDLVYGIDTACVYGGALTGLLLPEFKMISIPAKQNYWDLLRRKHRILE